MNRNIKTIILPSVSLLFLSSLLFLVTALFQQYQILKETQTRILDNIQEQQGIWDISQYYADPQLPGNASIYIFANDGYVLERWKPVEGFLDASDFKHLLEFSTPQTIKTISSERWLIRSKAIMKDQKTVGVITAAYYQTTEYTQDQINDQINQVLETLATKINIQGESLKVQDLDVRQIPFYISYQIVDQYNKIISKNNNTNSVDRVPNFIDPSYVKDQLSINTPQLIQDKQTKHFFLAINQPIIKNQTVLGVVITAIPLQPLLSLIRSYLEITLLTGLIGITGYLLFRRIHKKETFLIEPVNIPLSNIKVNFDKKNSVLNIGGNSIKIAYATNQYYLCDAIFEDPNKRWEIDELLERFGEHVDNQSWRKVYDTMKLVNRKTQKLLPVKLIHLEEKTYRLHPDLITS